MESLCSQLKVESDPLKILELIETLNLILEKREQRLRSGEDRLTN